MELRGGSKAQQARPCPCVGIEIPFRTLPQARPDITPTREEDRMPSTVSPPQARPSEAPDVSTAAGLLRFGNLFCDAKILLTAVELGLFTQLHTGPAPESEIRQRLGLNGRGLADFLQALVSIGVLVEHDGTYRNAFGAEHHLVAGKPGYIGGFLIGANFSLYPAYGSLAEALRTGAKQTAGEFSDLLGNPGALAQFAQMMDGLNEALAPELAARFDWTNRRTVLDVGGCRGNLLGHVLHAHAWLTGHVFDLPAMAPLFAEHMAARGLSDRATFHGGDFFADPLPEAEVMICGHVLSDWSPEQRVTLLRKAFESLAPGGALLVYDRMLHSGGDNRENLVASLNMLLVTDGGGEYTVAQLAEEAADAGFATITDQPLGAFDTLVTCTKNR